MAKSKRNIGLEILEGLREIKRGEYGRVITIPNVAGIREKTGLSQARFRPSCSVYRFAYAAGLGARPSSTVWRRGEHCLSSLTRIQCIARRCVMGRECGEFVNRFLSR